MRNYLTIIFILLITIYFAFLFRYNKLCGTVKKIVQKISKLDVRDPFRKQITDQLLEKLYDIIFLAFFLWFLILCTCSV